MESHPIDPVALVSGLLLGLAGLAIFADRQWDDVDVTAFAGAGVMVIALLLGGVVIVRQVTGTAEPETINVIDVDDGSEAVAEPSDESPTRD